jgi:PAS domain S-box-containing protein
MSLVSSAGVGGVMLRRLLPVAVLVPWALGWLTIRGEALGLYSLKVDQVLLAFGLMLAFSLLIYGSARSLERTDAQRRRAEESLRRSRDQWELTFDCMSEGMSYHDLEFNVVGSNKAIRQLLPNLSATPRKCYEVVHGTTCPPDYCPMKKTLATGQTHSSEFFEPKLNKYLFVRTDPVRDENGRTTRIVHVVEDITERKEAERTIARLAAIVQSSDDAIIGKDLDGTIRSWNAGARRIYGYDEEDVKGKSIATLCPPELQDDWREVVASVGQGELIQGRETIRMRKDGTRFFVSMTVSPIRDADGAIVGISTIARDISERKRAEQERARLLQLEQEARRELQLKNAEVEQLNAELEERVRMRTTELETSNKELEAFSYSVSHDLRAPLRSIDGFSHILLDEYQDKLDDEGKDFLARVRTASQQMGILIDALLQLSRVSRSEMKRDEVNLSEIVNSIAADLRKNAPERQVEFRIAQGAIERGDARLLDVAMRNLLENAWKFTSKRPLTVIEFGTVQNDGRRAYFVRDNGAGFDMAYGDKLFGAFQRLHSVAEFEGSGIGLATVQRILRRHGGRIWAEGAPDQGATFYFTLRG